MLDKPVPTGDVQSSGWAVKVSGVGVEFRGFKALNDFSCSFSSGVINAVVGPNGAGKSTLLNVLSGLATPSRGEVVATRRCDAEGTALHRRRPEQLWKWGLSRTFQIPNLYPRMTVLENIVVGLPKSRARPGVRPWWPFMTSPALAAAKEEATAWLVRFGVSPRMAGRRAADLTLPEQRTVELVRALVSVPRILLLDEPTSGLGINEGREVVRHALGHVAPETTVVLVTHDVPLVFEFCQWVAVMTSGALLVEGPADEIRTNPQVRSAYFGSET
jgi:ABC-type branched-subunit amino acid transport system ATPase component